MLNRFTVSRRVKWVLTSLIALSFVLIGRHLPEVLAKDQTNADIYKELKTFTDVLAIVQRDYVKEVDSRKMVEGAIKGMLATLDPHSGYLDPDFYQDLQVQTKGEFGGLGIEITIKDGLLVVVAPMEGSPAERAGIRAGDAIVKIEGKFTKEFSLVDAVKRLRGPKGTPIRISVYRKGQTDLIDVTLIRDNILVKSVRSRYLSDGYGYTRISQFMEKTADDLRDALAALKSKTGDGELHGLIVDLRNNPGGLLTQAIMVADLFLSDGVIVYTDGRVEGQRQKFYAHERGTEPGYPIVVLVNGGSASASEIVAGALKDHGRALILGTQTFGKGSVQTISPLSNGGAITLTTALYYTKSGNSIQARGVKPDIDMPDDHADEPQLPPQRGRNEEVREKDLPGALLNPAGGSGPEQTPLHEMNKVPPRPEIVNPETEDLDDLLRKDRQLQRAFDLLKTFNIFKGQNKSMAGASDTSPAS